MYWQELLVERIWDPFQHPKWLVFEVEGRLQIRPDQYHHAKELLAHTKESDGPGPITQLNMGEGKTRVILPMLALEWADRSCVVSRYTCWLSLITVGATQQLSLCSVKPSTLAKSVGAYTPALLVCSILLSSMRPAYV